MHATLSDIGDLGRNTQAKLIEGLQRSHRMAIAGARLLGFFPFLSRLPNAVYRRLTASHLVNCACPQKKAGYISIQLEALAALTQKLDQLLLFNIQMLEARMEDIECNLYDPYGRAATTLRDELQLTLQLQRPLGLIANEVMTVQACVLRFEGEGSLAALLPAIQGDLNRLTGMFAVIMSANSDAQVLTSSDSEDEATQAYLHAMHRLTETSEIMAVNLYHLQANAARAQSE